MYVIILYFWVASIGHFAEVQLDPQYLGKEACERARADVTEQAVVDAYDELSQTYGHDVGYAAGTCAMDDYKEASETRAKRVSLTFPSVHNFALGSHSPAAR